MQTNTTNKKKHVYIIYENLYTEDITDIHTMLE